MEGRGSILEGMAGEDLSEKIILEQRLDGSQRARQMSEGKSNPSRENSKCKDPEQGAGVTERVFVCLGQNERKEELKEVKSERNEEQGVLYWVRPYKSL